MHYILVGNFLRVETGYHNEPLSPFINIFRAPIFVQKCFAKLFSNCSLALQVFGTKAAHEMLMKLTTE